MPNSHEGHRNRHKLLSLQGEPSKAGRGREILLCLGCVAGRGLGGFRDQAPSRPDDTVSGCDECGEGLSRLEKTQQVKKTSHWGSASSGASGVLVWGNGVCSSKRLNNRNRERQKQCQSRAADQQRITASRWPVGPSRRGPNIVPGAEAPHPLCAG